MVRYREQFPEGKKRKELLTHTSKSIQKFAEGGPESIRDSYTWLDSSLDFATPWGWPLRRTFEKVLPKGTDNLRDYIQDVLKERCGEAVFVEFGGLGSAIAAEFSPGFFKESYGITLVDHTRDQTDGWTSERRTQDMKRGHHVIEANILDDALYEHLERQLQGKRPDLILERMGKGLKHLPAEPYTAAKVFQRWYRMLNQDGMMIVQVPMFMNKLIDPWVDLIQKTCGTTVVVEAHTNTLSESDAHPLSALRIIKRHGAPEELPMLDPQKVKTLGKRQYTDGSLFSPESP